MGRKMGRMKKILFVLLFIFTTIPVTRTQAGKSEDYWPKQSEKITSKAAVLMDMDTGTILYKKNMNDSYYPASITKILTTLIAVENSNMDEIVTFSRDAVYKTEGSGIWRDVGEKMTMKECLYAVMLESANECAYAVAEHVGGTYQAFIKMMNDKAKELGCTSSHFVNPHGLPDEKHYVTAKDMALIAKAAYDNEAFRLICGTKVFVIPPTNKHSEKTFLVNHHKMLYPKDTAAYLYDYCMGGKTGYTVAAGNTLVTYAQKGGMSLVAVVLNADSPAYWTETRALFDYGFENFNLCNVAEYTDAGDNYEKEKYDTLNVNEPYAQVDPQAKIIMPKTVDFSKAAMEITYEDLSDGVLAQLKYTYGGREIGTADIIRTNVPVDNSGLTDSNDTEEIKNSQAKPETITDKSPESEEQTGNTGQAAEKDGQKFDIRVFFTDTVGKISEFFQSVPSVRLIAAGGMIVVVLIFLIAFRMIFHNSYIFRQRMADRRRRKRESRQYTIIRDTRKYKGRRRRNH